MLPFSVKHVLMLKIKINSLINSSSTCYCGYDVYLIVSTSFQLNFIGVTVDQDRHYIHFPSSKHMFTPVPVGEKISPKQVHLQN